MLPSISESTGTAMDRRTRPRENTLDMELNVIVLFFFDLVSELRTCDWLRSGLEGLVTSVTSVLSRRGVNELLLSL